MDYDLHITFMDKDMGSCPIRLDQSGRYELGDACYPLVDYIGCEGHDEMMQRIFAQLHGTGDHGAMNPDAATSGQFDGLVWHIVEAGSADQPPPKGEPMAPSHPNRSGSGPSRNLTPEEIREARSRIGHSQKGAAEMIHATERAWQEWEAGNRRMHAGLWELFQIKCKEL